MSKVKVDFSRCKGCFLCTSVCPKGVLLPSTELGAKGFEIVQIDEEKECIGCGIPDPQSGRGSPGHLCGIPYTE